MSKANGNPINLIPFNERTPEEVNRIVTMGGIASGEARREKKKTLETLEMLLAKKVKTDDGEITREEACMLSAIRRCLERGEVDFLEFVAKLRGELVSKSEVDVSGSVPAVLTDVCEDEEKTKAVTE